MGSVYSGTCGYNLYHALFWPLSLPNFENLGTKLIFFVFSQRRDYCMHEAASACICVCVGLYKELIIYTVPNQWCNEN